MNEFCTYYSNIWYLPLSSEIFNLLNFFQKAMLCWSCLECTNTTKKKEHHCSLLISLLLLALFG